MKMLEQNCSVLELSKKIGVSKAALYRRLNGVVAFTVPEMQACKEHLNLTDAERDKIFFNPKVT